MSEDMAASNVNRAYSLAATCIAIFTFTLIFLYPRYASGEVHGLPFQATLVVLGLATFSFVFATLLYYAASRDGSDRAESARESRRGDQMWVAGYTLLFLSPSIVLVAVGLLLVAAVWFALWLAYAAYVRRYFPRVRAGRGG
jgi:cobalamin synthase